MTRKKHGEGGSRGLERIGGRRRLYEEKMPAQPPKEQVPGMRRLGAHPRKEPASNAAARASASSNAKEACARNAAGRASITASASITEEEASANNSVRRLGTLPEQQTAKEGAANYAGQARGVVEAGDAIWGLGLVPRGSAASSEPLLGRIIKVYTDTSDSRRSLRGSCHGGRNLC